MNLFIQLSAEFSIKLAIVSLTVGSVLALIVDCEPLFASLLSFEPIF